jgi:DNA-binding Lrp family transcriptional regulator
MKATDIRTSVGASDSPYDARRFDQLSEAEVIRRIGGILATALLRSGCPRRHLSKSGRAPVASAQVNQASLLRDETERQIVSFLQCAGPTSPSIIGRTLGFPQRVVTRRLTRLRATGVCEAAGETRAVRYRVRDDFSGN